MQVQQQAPQIQRPKTKQRRFLWLRISVFIIGLLLITAGIIFNIVNAIGGVIAFASLALFASLIQYAFPLPTDTPDTPEIPQPIQLSVTVQAPPALPPATYQHTDQQLGPKTIWNVPYRRNLYFTGREEVLRTLHERFSTSNVSVLTQSQAISGLGGVGKTQIAVEYAYRHREEYHFVLWVNAETRDTIIASFLELATRLALPEQQEADQDRVVATVNRWFTEHDRWLLLFDNADDLTLAEEFLQTSESGHLLLTTRNQTPGVLADSLDIETMNKEEGTLLVLRRAKLLARDAQLAQAPPEERTQAEQIVRAMDGLPLALDQAAAYIEETRCTLAAFLEKYQQQRDDILRRRGRTGKEHPLPVATTWSLSFAQVEQLNQTAADLLRVCSFLAPDAIPEELMLDGVTELGPLLATWKNDTTQLDEAIGTLNRFSLVRRDREERTISLHRLVQAAQLLEMDEATRKLWAERTVRAINQAFPYVEVSTWPQCERYLPHAIRCSKLIEEYIFVFPEAARLLNQVAFYLDDRAQYPEAEPLYQRALAILDKTLGPQHPNTKTGHENYATLLESMKRKKK